MWGCGSTIQYKQHGRHGKEGHDAFHKLLAEGKLEEAVKLAYFQNMLQYAQYGRHGKDMHDAFRKLQAEGKPEEAVKLPYFQDTFQQKQYGRHGKDGHDAFIELVVANEMSLARATPYFLDTFQYQAYGCGGHARYKQVTANVREHASVILIAEQNGDSVEQNGYYKVQTKWMCTAKCCANKERWYGRSDKFGQHRKQHNGGDALFVGTVKRAKNGAKLGYCSLCPSAPMTVMSLQHMKTHLARADIHV